MLKDLKKFSEYIQSKSVFLGKKKKRKEKGLLLMLIPEMTKGFSIYMDYILK